MWIKLHIAMIIHVYNQQLRDFPVTWARQADILCSFSPQQMETNNVSITRPFRIIRIYPLVMTNSLPWYKWPIEIDGLPSYKMVIFHGYVK